MSKFMRRRCHGDKVHTVFNQRCALFCTKGASVSYARTVSGTATCNIVSLNIENVFRINKFHNYVTFNIISH